MWPVLACSVVSLTVVIRKTVYLSGLLREMPILDNDVRLLVDKNMLVQAVATCDKSSSPLARILRAGLLQFSCPKETISSAMQEAARREIPLIEENVPILSTMATIAPLLGVLGAIFSLAQVFYTAYLRSQALNPLTLTDMAHGIMEALIVTATALVVTIAILLAYNYLSGLISNIIRLMEHSANGLLQAMTRVVNNIADDTEKTAA